VTPYSETYNVGDTITISSKFHKEVYDKNTQEYYDVTGVEWGMGTGIHRIDTMLNIQYYTQEYFSFAADSDYDYSWSYFSSGASYLAGEFNFQNDSFDLEIKLIAMHPGIFHMVHTSTLVDINNDQDFEGKCRLTGFEGHTKMNEGRDNNIHLMAESPEPHYREWILEKPEERFHKEGGYCFRVVE